MTKTSVIDTAIKESLLNIRALDRAWSSSPYINEICVKNKYQSNQLNYILQLILKK